MSEGDWRHSLPPVLSCSHADISHTGAALYNAGNTDIREIPGRRITAYGKLREPPGADNPGCFDYRIYLRSRGIGIPSVQKHRGDLDDEPVSVRARYKRWLFEARENFLDRFEDPEIRAFIKGTVFGDKSDISEETLQDFTDNGTGHILAVSGLHTGFLYSLLRFLQGKEKNAAGRGICDHDTDHVRRYDIVEPLDNESCYGAYRKSSVDVCEEAF